MRGIGRNVGILIALAIVAAAISVMSIALNGRIRADDGGVDKSYVRPAGPSSATSTLTASTLARHGIYRIVPASFAGSLSYRDLYNVSAPTPGVRTNDVSVLTNSPLHVTLHSLPDGFSLTGMDTLDGDSNSVLRQVFWSSDKTQELEVVRARKNVDPIDIFAPPDQDIFAPASASGDRSALTMRLDWIAGHEAVIFSPVSKIPLEFQIAQVIFYQGGVNTTITASGVPVEQLVQLAQDIAGQAAQ